MVFFFGVGQVSQISRIFKGDDSGESDAQMGKRLQQRFSQLRGSGIAVQMNFRLSGQAVLHNLQCVFFRFPGKGEQS